MKAVNDSDNFSKDQFKTYEPTHPLSQAVNVNHYISNLLNLLSKKKEPDMRSKKSKKTHNNSKNYQSSLRQNKVIK